MHGMSATRIQFNYTGRYNIYNISLMLPENLRNIPTAQNGSMKPIHINYKIKR